MNDNPHVLIVDDDEQICEMVEGYLTDQNYRVTVTHDGAGMRRCMATGNVDLVILDVVLRGEDGLNLARELRAESDVPIVMLTGRGDPVDRIVGLEMGADDYLSKPFHLRELLARVRSVLRRSASSAGIEEASQEVAHFAGWRLDLPSRELTSPTGQEVRLTGGEFDLLAVFVTNPSQVLNRDRLLDLTRNREAGPFDRTIDVQVGRLRRKLGDDPQSARLIKTVRGGGYIFSAPVEWG
jgi:two-component system OmpR family response regulator